MFTAAKNDQTRIGWRLAFRGFLSFRWRLIQQKYLEDERQPNAEATALTWSAKFHTAIHELFEHIWSTRNIDEHGETPEQVTVARKRNARTAIDYYFFPAPTLPEDENFMSHLSRADIISSSLDEQEL